MTIRHDRRTSCWTRVAVALLAAGAVAVGAAPAKARPAVPASGEPVRAMLRVDARAASALPHALFVGQMVPVTIRAYFLGGTGVSLTSAPRLSSDAFTLSDLPEKPAQTSVELHGLPYTVLTWTGNLTAARAGDARLDLELPVELSYREGPREPVFSGGPSAPASGDDDGADADDPFAAILKSSPFASDPFFSQMFKGGDPFAGMMRDLAGTVRQRSVTLRAPISGTQVLSLPEPQPAGFTGAVGHFDIAASVSPGPHHVGEPITLRLAVTGQGSFARLSLAGAPSTDELTSYGASATAPVDGQKVFTQTLVPRRTGTLTIPAITLTAFDPRTRRYVSRATQPLRIEVLPGAPEAGPPPLTPTADDVAAPAGAGAPASTPLPAAVHATLTPIVVTRRFQAALAALLLAAIGAALLGRLVRTGALARQWTARRLRRQVSVEQRALREAARRGDGAALFAGARRALQARLGAAWGLPPDAIGAADVTRRLGKDGAAIREIFERADRHSYAGGAAGDGDLDRWPERISAELRALESRT